MLGFDQFEFIQELLERRREVVESLLHAPTSVGSASSLRLRDQTDVKPNYGAQITIQVGS